MKILEIASDYLGTELYNNLFNSLVQQGQEVCVYVPVSHDEKEDNRSYEVQVSRCFNKNDRYVFEYKHKKIFKDVQSRFDFSKIEMVHAHTLFTDGSIACDINKAYGKPYIVAVRNTDVNLFLKYMFWLRKKGVDILKNAKQVVFLSNAYKKFVVETYVPEGLRQQIYEKSIVIPNGINPVWLKESVSPKVHTESKKISIVYSGRIEKNKNCATTVKACKLLQEKGYDLIYTIIGRISEPKYYETFKDEPFVRHIEPQNFDSLIQIYKQQDIFVMPSFFETFGLSYAEAMSQGLPVVYSRGQGFDGQFSEGEVGYGVKSDNAEEIAEKIICILDNYSQISSAAINGAKRFNWNEIGEQYAKLYAAAVND